VCLQYVRDVTSCGIVMDDSVLVRSPRMQMNDIKGFYVMYQPFSNAGGNQQKLHIHRAVKRNKASASICNEVNAPVIEFKISRYNRHVVATVSKLFRQVEARIHFTCSLFGKEGYNLKDFNSGNPGVRSVRT